MHNNDALYIFEIAWTPLILTSVGSSGQAEILMIKMYLQFLEGSLFQEPWAAMFWKLSSQAAPVEVVAAINIANLATYLHLFNI